MNTKKILSSFLMAAGALAIISAGIFWNNFNKVEATPTPVPLGSVKVTGYAWSDNIGWIKFDGLSSYPAPGSDWVAKANTSTGVFTGWARACAGTVPPGDCSSMASRTDGWDG